MLLVLIQMSCFHEETLQTDILKCKFDFFFGHKQKQAVLKITWFLKIFSHDGDGPITATTNADASVSGQKIWHNIFLVKLQCAVLKVTHLTNFLFNF